VNDTDALAKGTQNPVASLVSGPQPVMPRSRQIYLGVSPLPLQVAPCQGRNASGRHQLAFLPWPYSPLCGYEVSSCRPFEVCR
jgi:hypothetical protein